MRVLYTGLLAIAATALLVAYWIGFRAPGFGLYHDDGIYLVTAKSLAGGAGYRILSLPGQPPQAKYPPLLPLAVSGIWKVFPGFPQNLPLLKLVPLLSSVIWQWLAFVYLKEISRTTWTAKGITLLTLSSPWVLFFSVSILSETMFACLVTGALLSLRRLGTHEKEARGYLFLASGLTAAAILTRTAGFPLILAGTGALLTKRRIRAALGFALTTTALVLPWIAWSSHYHPAPGSITAYYSGVNYTNWNILTNFRWDEKLVVIGKNIFFSLLSPGLLMGMQLPRWGLFALLVGGLILYGFILELANGATELTLFLILYVGMLVIWVWPPTRFFVPIFPFLLLFGYTGIAHFLNTVLRVRSSSRTAGWVSVLVLMPFLTHSLFLQAQHTLRTKSPSFSDHNQDDWAQLTALWTWIAVNTPSDAVLLGNLDPAMYLSTGRKSVRGFQANPFELFYAARPNAPLGSPSQFIENILREHVDYVVRTPSSMFQEGPFLNAIIDQAVSNYPEVFTLRTQGDDPNYRIYQVNRSRLASDFRKSANKPRS